MTPPSRPTAAVEWTVRPTCTLNSRAFVASPSRIRGSACVCHVVVNANLAVRGVLGLWLTVRSDTSDPTLTYMRPDCEVSPEQVSESVGVFRARPRGVACVRVRGCCLGCVLAETREVQPPEGFSVGVPSGASVSGGRTDVPSGAPPEVVSGAFGLVSPLPAPLGSSSGSVPSSIMSSTYACAVAALRG